jgi:hypothetical protein
LKGGKEQEERFQFQPFYLANYTNFQAENSVAALFLGVAIPRSSLNISPHKQTGFRLADIATCISDNLSMRYSFFAAKLLVIQYQ